MIPYINAQGDGRFGPIGVCALKRKTDLCVAKIWILRIRQSPCISGGFAILKTALTAYFLLHAGDEPLHRAPLQLQSAVGVHFQRCMDGTVPQDHAHRLDIGANL